MCSECESASLCCVVVEVRVLRCVCVTVAHSGAIGWLTVDCASACPHSGSERQRRCAAPLLCCAVSRLAVSACVCASAPAARGLSCCAGRTRVTPARLLDVTAMRRGPGVCVWTGVDWLAGWARVRVRVGACPPACVWQKFKGAVNRWL